MTDFQNKQLKNIEDELFMFYLNYKCLQSMDEDIAKNYIIRDRKKLMNRCKRLLDEISLFR